MTAITAAMNGAVSITQLKNMSVEEFLLKSEKFQDGFRLVFNRDWGEVLDKRIPKELNFAYFNTFKQALIQLKDSHWVVVAMDCRQVFGGLKLLSAVKVYTLFDIKEFMEKRIEGAEERKKAEQKMSCVECGINE